MFAFVILFPVCSYFKDNTLKIVESIYIIVIDTIMYLN